LQKWNEEWICYNISTPNKGGYKMVKTKNVVPGEDRSILGWLYELYSEAHPMDNEAIKADFEGLYEKMNGMTIQETDRVIYPVCSLCRDHELSGFQNGVQLGVQLALELGLVMDDP
jgi:hypothetical protein